LYERIASILIFTFITYQLLNFGKQQAPDLKSGGLKERKGGMSRDISAYLKTKVSHYRTQEVITKLLENRGITEIRFTQSIDQIMLEFNYPHQVDNKELKLGVRFVLKLPESNGEKERQQIRNQYFRALFYVLKSKLEAVEFGIREFGQEFLGDLVYQLPNGKTATVSEIIAPQIEKSMIDGTSEVLMLPNHT